MRVTRVFVEEMLRPGREHRLGAAAAAHVSRVLRLGTGDELTLFNGRGGEYAATIIEAKSTAVRVRIGAHRAVGAIAIKIALVQGISRGDAWTG
jgi:16S rRNA (uracil1498-N3)-methyltransferase